MVEEGKLAGLDGTVLQKMFEDADDLTIKQWIPSPFRFTNLLKAEIGLRYCGFSPKSKLISDLPDYHALNTGHLHTINWNCKPISIVDAKKVYIMFT